MLTERQLEALSANFLPVTKAPSFSKLMGELPMEEDLHCETSIKNIDNTELYDAESKRRYLACDQAGDVWLIQNPALATWQLVLGAKVVTRMEPQPFMSAGDAKALLGITGRERK